LRGCGENRITEVCCPRFDKAFWDEKTFAWEDKLFIKEKLPQYYLIPIRLLQLLFSVLYFDLSDYLPEPLQGFSRIRQRMWKQAVDAEAAPEEEDFLLLSYTPSRWRCEYYLAVTSEIPGVENVKITGTFLSKVFDEPKANVVLWTKEMKEYAQYKGKNVQAIYYYYPTCPKCAKERGHNYVVAFAKVE